ncbi:MAG: hypothetical protein GY783_18655 [Gammaproteobacteria bacterium]|nr:hypothetical protein [Gammaproteobacteria bacterium]
MHNRSRLIIAILLVGPPASADTFYFGANIGVSIIDDTANAALSSSSALGVLPDEISLDGRPYDSNETASGAFIGWNANDWLAVEFGYTDLGNTGQSLPIGFVGPVPLAMPPALPTDIPPGGGLVAAFPTSFNSNASALGVEEWFIAAKFSKSLISDLAANWSVGITHAQFDADGRLTINEIVTLNPLVINRMTRPYASPESEIGFNFGFGFAWDFNGRFSADIGYRRHDTRVIDVETVTLQLIITL